MSSIQLDGVTVYVSAIESVEDGVSAEYDRLYREASNELFFQALASTGDTREVEFPDVKDHPAVIVKLTSGREFRIVGKTRKEVEQDILRAKRRDRG